MSALIDITSISPSELLFASAQRTHLVHIYGHPGGDTEHVVVTPSLAAAIQVTRERLNASGNAVAEVTCDAQRGIVLLLATDSALLAAICPSEPATPPIDREVRQACAALERGDPSGLANLFDRSTVIAAV